MNSLSVIIITKNEQHHISECIKSILDIATEIIVLDSGSSDDTVSIAKALGAKVSTNTNWEGFGHQKNLALEQAKCDWILSIDADERVTPELSEEIKEILKHADSHSWYEIIRKSWYCGKIIKYSGWQNDRVLRLFKRGCAKFTNSKVHERVEPIYPPASPRSKVFTLRNSLTHYSYSDFKQVIHKVNLYSTLWAEQKYEEGRNSTPINAVFHGVIAFVKTYLIKLGFLDGALGFALAFSNAEAAYYKYLKLWLLNKTLSGK